MEATPGSGGADVEQVLDLDDIQGTVLRQRPNPYTGAYYLLQVTDPAHGREALRRLIPHVASAADWWDPPAQGWLSVALSSAGVRAIGVPEAILRTFAPEFLEGMAARATTLGDTGASGSEHWETPFISGAAHIALALFAPDEATLRGLISQTRTAAGQLAGVRLIYELRTPQLPSGRTHLGFVDGIGEPYIEGCGLVSVIQARRGQYGYLPGFGPRVKSGEFVLGYVNELGRVGDMPSPDILGRNGTYVAFRKLHLDVAAYRRYLAAHADSPEEQRRLAAKLVGRWPNGAPLVLSPDREDDAIATDPQRVNDFTYSHDDPVGLRCPVGAHIRRMNPRDGLGGSTDIQLHRVLRRGATYGPELPDGVMDDDGEDRGIAFIFLGAELGRQFEFVKSQWTNDGDFAGLGDERDPLVGNHDDGHDTYTIPHRPIRRRLTGLPTFARTRGGEYFFLPGLRALEWLAAGRYDSTQ